MARTNREMLAPVLVHTEGGGSKEPTRTGRAGHTKGRRHFRPAEKNISAEIYIRIHFSPQTSFFIRLKTVTFDQPKV